MGLDRIFREIKPKVTPPAPPPISEETERLRADTERLRADTEARRRRTARAGTYGAGSELLGEQLPGPAAGGTRPTGTPHRPAPSRRRQGESEDTPVRRLGAWLFGLVQTLLLVTLFTGYGIFSTLVWAGTSLGLQPLPVGVVGKGGGKGGGNRRNAALEAQQMRLLQRQEQQMARQENEIARAEAQQAEIAGRRSERMQRRAAGAGLLGAVAQRLLPPAPGSGKERQ